MLTIHNPGTLDLTAVTTFGISAKPGSSPIGFFGTGLKYAIAVTLRLGGSVRIDNDGQKVSFSTATSSFRDKEFDFIEMHVDSDYTRVSSRLPFTTELGKTWAPWQALREFICNALDEGGYVLRKDDPVPTEGVTFFLDLPDYDALAASKFTDIFLDEPATCLEFPNLKVYPTPSKYLYYRGVRVHDFGQAAHYTYNITGPLELTEDRTAKYPDSAMNAALAEMVRFGNEAMARTLCSAQEGTVEGDFGYSQWWTYGEDFINGVRAHRASGGAIPRSLFHALISTLVKDTHEHTYTLTEHEQLMYDLAVSTLAKAGHPITAKVHFVETLGPMTMGQVLDGQIFIAREAFRMGTRQLMGTLFEEQLHISAGVLDLTRPMQNMLIDMLMGEYARKTGVVL